MTKNEKACERAYLKLGYANVKNYYMFKAGWNAAKASTK